MRIERKIGIERERRGGNESIAEFSPSRSRRIHAGGKRETIVSNVIGATDRLCFLMRSARYFDAAEAARTRKRARVGGGGSRGSWVSARSERGEHEDEGGIGPERKKYVVKPD